MSYKKYTLSFKLQDTKLTRKVTFTSGLDFSDLHVLLQIVFGWEDYHLHEFTVGKLTIRQRTDEETDEEDDSFDFLPAKCKYEDEVGLDMILANYSEFLYHYDFGADWTVKIKVENVIETEKPENPKVISLCGGMAKEDCGPEDLTGDYSPADKAEINLILEETFDIV